ncbi:MAG: hypothetical protein ACYC6Y_04615 [Thermoguttaceae bacterium]
MTACLAAWILAAITAGPGGDREPAAAGSTVTRPAMLVVVGAAGEEHYGKQFLAWAERWRAAATSANATFLQLGTESPSQTIDKQRLEESLSAWAGEGDAPAWLILIGHGTFDGQAARFNLRGPDVTAAEFAGWLEPCHRPLVVVNCASSSGPFINALSRTGRVVITATKSGFELNFARFGEHLSAAVMDPDADLDKDGQTTLLEAFLLASARVREFYEQSARLATEQALLDDNGDGRGTPAAWFRGIHPVRQAKDGAPLDGPRAHQFLLVPNPAERKMPAPIRHRRDELEQEIARVREEKEKLGDDAYYAKLEPLLVELARLYRDLD